MPDLTKYPQITHCGAIKTNTDLLLLLHCFLGQFDMDGDGEITTEELRSAMMKLMGEHMNRREIDAIVKEADDNGDGTVDFEGTLSCSGMNMNNRANVIL